MTKNDTYEHINLKDISQSLEPKPKIDIFREMLWLCFSIILVMFFLYYTIEVSQSVSDGIDDIMLKNHFNSNDLKEPFENTYTLKEPYDYELDEFYDLVKQVYFYEEGLYDCKYWSLIWASYFDYNRYNYNYEKVGKHIFVIAYNKDSYCIADQNKLECTNYE